jgi:molybdate transport repressor ModE-like protein
MEDGLGVPLTQRATGGKHGGGTQVTAAAKVYIEHFHAYIAGLKDLADRQFHEAFGEE